MEPLAKLFVSILELAETELTMLKKGVVRLALSLVMVIAAGVFGVIGLCWVLEGLFEFLVKLTNRPVAFLISGVLFLAVAGILGVMAFSSKAKPKVATPEHQTSPPPAEGKPHDPASLRIAS